MCAFKNPACCGKLNDLMDFIVFQISKPSASGIFLSLFIRIPTISIKNRDSIRSDIHIQIYTYTVGQGCLKFMLFSLFFYAANLLNNNFLFFGLFGPSFIIRRYYTQFPCLFFSKLLSAKGLKKEQTYSHPTALFLYS